MTTSLPVWESGRGQGARHQDGGHGAVRRNAAGQGSHQDASRLSVRRTTGLSGQLASDDVAQTKITNTPLQKKKNTDEKHHLWIRKGTAGSGKNALRRIDLIMVCSDEEFVLLLFI
jgi:hypothetical protein